MDDELAERLALVSQTWVPHQRLHVGNVAWAAAGGDGGVLPNRVLTWGEPMVAFADIWSPATPDGASEVSVHISPRATAKQRLQIVEELIEATSLMSSEVSTQDNALIEMLAAYGFQRMVRAPWFVQLWRDLVPLDDLDAFEIPDGYRIRALDASDDDVARRVEVHRDAWSPQRIKGLLGLELSGSENESSYTALKHRQVMSSGIYQPQLDLVVEAHDGQLAAYALGWLDAHQRVVLFEPVGTHPAQAGRGLARAVCAEVMRRARELGATQAVVGPRGDPGYPIPRRLYEALGMREVSQFAPYSNVPG